MTAKIVIYSFIFFAVSTFVHGKTYKRCELIKELVEKHSFNDEHAAKVSCIAEGALFETDRLNNHAEKVSIYSIKPSYGIFQISSEYWCLETGVGGICNMNCKDLIDDDITDDIGCLKKIAPNFDGDDWYYPWKELTGPAYYCKWNEVLQNCTGDAEKEKTPWKSLDDCLSNFPEFNYVGSSLGFNGFPALKHEFPHAAVIGWTQTEPNDVKWLCGGSLITEDTVMTAVHCTFNLESREPDVVRLGDLNLETEDDEKDTQQFEILSIIRHPEYKPRYNDIALIKLKSKVNVTKFVMPACLWARQDIPRDINLEACGFGQTEFLGDISPILIKVIVSTISTDDCQAHYESDRFLKEGLLERIHLCADDKTGSRMDTCKGDSGGPLEMKLHYVKTLVPFVVAVTAFGQGCGFDTPGVYTRVWSYIDWIKQHVPDLELDPIKCSRKYSQLRFSDTLRLSYEFEPQKIVLGDTLEQIAPATIISDRFLLATASDLKKISNPNRVQFWSNSSQISIEKIFYHPNHIEGEPENDLALIKLKSRIRWKDKDHPTCVSSKNIGDEGYQQETYIDPMHVNDQWTDQLRNVTIASDPSYCPARDKTNNSFTDNFLCFKSDTYHIPDFCNVPYGSPVTHNGFSKVSQQTLIKGLAVQSLDCTFTLATDISKHYDWINSVVFGSLETEIRVDDDEELITFRDSDLVPGDVCVQHNGERGICRNKRDCKKKIVDMVLLCAGDAICC